MGAPDFVNRPFHALYAGGLPLRLVAKSTGLSVAGAGEAIISSGSSRLWTEIVTVRVARLYAAQFSTSLLEVS